MRGTEQLLRWRRPGSLLTSDKTEEGPDRLPLSAPAHQEVLLFPTPSRSTTLRALFAHAHIGPACSLILC